MSKNEKYRLGVEVEDPEEIPEELGPGVPKTPYVSVLDEGGDKVKGEYTDEKGYVEFELREGTYQLLGSSLTETGSKKVDLDESKRVTLETSFRNSLEQIPGI